MANEFYCPVKIVYGQGGPIRAIYRFGELTANAEILCLQAPILGKLAFYPSDVVSLQAFVIIPVLSWGVTINHVKTDYRRIIRFTNAFMKPQNLIQKITEAGFIPSALRTDNCLACGRPLLEGADKCSSCGWTYRVGEKTHN